MGSTGVLLVIWRFIASKVLSGGQEQKNDDYRRGNPFELFEVSILFNINFFMVFS
jgi:hypothetical protein